jgi:microcystin-dependent protein
MIINYFITLYDGSTGTFNLPDMRSRFPLGLGQGDELTNRVISNTGGAETHTLTPQEMPSHNHGVFDPGHTHSYSNNTNDQAVGTTIFETAADETNTSATTGSSTTGITINNAGGGQAHNNMPPYIVLNYIIKY